MLRVLARVVVATNVLALILAAAPRPAQADPSQLCRAGMNVALAPLDTLLIPYIVSEDMYFGLTEWDDPWFHRIVGFVPGFAYLSFLQLFGTGFRVIAGGLEAPLGVVALFREEADKPIFRAQDEAWQVYSNDLGPCPIRIGTHYNMIQL